MYKKILPPAYLLFALIAMLIIHFTFPITQFIPLPWNLFGLIPLVLGIGFNLIADSAFHKAGTTVKPFLESNALLTDGVYGISRHPMYLGFVLVLIGAASLLGSLTSWVIVPIFIILMEIVFIRIEERMMAQKYELTWLDYKKKVRRWL